MKNPIINAGLKFNCPVNWDSMEDTIGGKNCQVCQKKVFDLTNCNQDEMDVILAQNNYHICAKFSSSQLAPQQISFPFWKKWASAAMVLIGFNLFNSKAVAQNVKVAINKNNYNYIPMPKNFLGEVVVNSKYDSLPQFPGGVEALNAFLDKKISFKDNEDMTYVQFDIDTLGIVKNFRILQGAIPITEKEAAQIVKQSPRWSPAILRGRPVEINYTLQITFSDPSIK